MKSLSSRKTVFLSLAVIALILLGWGYTSGFFFERGLTPCAPPPGVMVDGVARANVYTWLDKNGNGISDPGESPLPGVEIVYPALSKPTNEQGQAETSQFKPGCACKCWEHEYVEVRAPEGYQATTPLRLELTGETGLYSFGFERVEPDVSILPEQTATPVRPTPSPTAVPATKTQASTTTVEMTMESGYPAPPASPTPLSPAEPFRDCKRTPGLTGCEPSAPVLAGHVAFYDLEGGQLVGIDLKTGAGWAMVMPMPDQLKWSPDGSQLLIMGNPIDGEDRLREYILLNKDGTLVDRFVVDWYASWQPQGSELQIPGEPPTIRSDKGEEAFLDLLDNKRAISYRADAASEWQTDLLEIQVQEYALEIHSWLPGTPNIVISQMSGISTYSSVVRGSNIFLYDTQTKELKSDRDFQGHLDPQFSAVQGPKLAMINLYNGTANDTLAVLDSRTGEIDRPLPREQSEVQSYALWQMAWQPGNEETEGLFALMVEMVETNWSDLVPSEMFPTRGIYLYDRTANQAQKIREISKERVGGNFHFTADGRCLLYNEGPQEERDATRLSQGAQTRMFARDMETGKEWLLLDRLVNPGVFLGYINWDLIAVTME